MPTEARYIKIALFVAYLVCIQDPVHGCRTSHLQQEPMGYTCRDLSDVIYNSSAMAYPQCLWHCLWRNNCVILMYDAKHGYCLLASDLCLQAVSDVNVIVTYLGPLHDNSLEWWNSTNEDNRNNDCIEWRRNQSDWPVNLVVVNDVGNDDNYAVARIGIGDILLPGAYRNGNTKSVMDHIKHLTETGEYLLVQDGCSVMWAAWDSTSGSDLPTSAIVGGYLANGSPLYVAKGWAKPDTMKIGYYNPETARGHFWAYAEYQLTDIFILVRA